MDLKQLRYFRQIYADGSIQKAAKNLYVSQQAVSRMLLNLEDDLNVALFLRSPRGVEPTEWGKLLARETEDILPRIDRLTTDIRYRSGNLGGSVRMGVLFGHLGEGTKLEIGALQSFRENYPQILLSHVNGTPRDLADMLLDGKVDFVFSTFPVDPAPFRCWKLFDYEWRAAMGTDHPLATRESLTVKDLARQTLIFPGDAQYDRMQILRALPGDAEPTFVSARGIFYDIVLQQLLPMNAVMLCTAFQARLLNPEVIRCIPFITDLLDAQIFLICRADAPLSRAAHMAVSHLINTWGFTLSGPEAAPTGEGGFVAPDEKEIFSTGCIHS